MVKISAEYYNKIKKAYHFKVDLQTIARKNQYQLCMVKGFFILWLIPFSVLTRWCSLPETEMSLVPIISSDILSYKQWAKFLKMSELSFKTKYLKREEIKDT